MENFYLAIALDDDQVIDFELHDTMQEVEEWTTTIEKVSIYRLLVFEINTRSGDVWKLDDRSKV